MLRLLRVFAALLLALLLVLGAGLIVLRFSLPQTRGAVTVDGVRNPVVIVRDAAGVPHIEAQSREDAAFGLGFVHAQDRLWQLELQRRIGSGRLAEAFGPDALDRDRFLRTLGLRRAAERTLEGLSPSARGVVDAYVAGVNAHLRSRRGPLPPEFLLTGVRPDPFEAADVVAWSKMMAWNLSGEYGDELLRVRLEARLGPERAAALYPAYPRGVVGAVAGAEGASADEESAGGAEGGEEPAPASPGAPPDDPPAAPDGSDDGADGSGARDETRALLATLPLDALGALLPSPPPGGLGSNAFAVSGRRSASGAPLLANDPHQGLQAPSLFYLAHLSTPEGDVIGATLPLTPAVLIGRNDRIAWGFTNAGVDDQDLFVERVDPADPGRYLTPEGSEPFELRDEIIRVRGADPVTITVRATRHGPVLSDLVGGDVAADVATRAETGEEAGDGSGGEAVLALAWTALAFEDTTLEAGLALGRAADWDEFRAALARWTAPTQAVVYADVDGSIGLVLAGAVPLRPPGADAPGVRPVPGWDGSADWTGVVPPEERPVVLDPESGVIVAANQRVVRDDYPYLLADDWSAPYRAERIAALLDAAGRHSPETFAAIQADVVSLAAREFAPLLTGAAPQTPLARAAQALLLGWDGRMDADDPAPLVYAAWYRALGELIFADDLGPLWDDFRDEHPLLLREVFAAAAEGSSAPGAASNDDGDTGAAPPDPATDPSAWCDDRATREVESCERIAERALRRAVAELAERYGDDPDRWRWGDAHPSVFDHTPLSGTPLRRFVEIRRPNGGDAFTVDAAPPRESEPFVNGHAAAYRGIYDLADPFGGNASGAGASRFLVAPGQSGNPLSWRYRNLAGAWFRNDYVPLVTDPEAYRRQRVGILTLEPPPEP